jgi:asparagine N-glycosylation enzyme membrane subunit Stt3
VTERTVSHVFELDRRAKLARERVDRVEQLNRESHLRRLAYDEGIAVGMRAARNTWGLRVLAAFVMGLLVGSWSPKFIAFVYALAH